MAVETITIADRARDVLDRFGPPPSEHTVDRAERVAWAVARFDGGDHDGAAEDLTALLDGWLPEPFAAAAPRILTGERAVRFVTAALGGGHPYRPFVSGRNTPEYAVAGTLARLVAGHADAEEALLRTVLGVRPGEHLSAHLRVARISAAFAALAEVHAGKLEVLDGWAALLDEQDRPRLAAAAALLGPLGLAETDRRCGTVEDVDGERLVVAFAGADRFDDALALATRLGPGEQQRSLLALATPGLPAARSKALVARGGRRPARAAAEPAAGPPRRPHRPAGPGPRPVRRPADRRVRGGAVERRRSAADARRRGPRGGAGRSRRGRR